eukprot:scaffold90171_cov57-Phaeocystis_antarctica.AAC.4
MGVGVRTQSAVWGRGVRRGGARACLVKKARVRSKRRRLARASQIISTHDSPAACGRQHHSGGSSSTVERHWVTAAYRDTSDYDGWLHPQNRRYTQVHCNGNVQRRLSQSQRFF